MSLSMTIEIPALDRLCAWLESRDKAGIVEAIEAEIVQKLKEAAESGALEKAAKAPEPETAPEALEGVQEPPKPETTEKPAAPEAPAPEASPVTLDSVQRAAAQMRDAGKLKAVTDMFPEYGIKKLSDLKGDALQAFGGRLRELGANI